MLPKGLWLAAAVLLPLVALGWDDPLLAQVDYVDPQERTSQLERSVRGIKTFVNDVHNMLNSSGNFLGHMDNETELNVRDAYNYARERTADFLALAENQTDYTGYTRADYTKYGPTASGEFLRLFGLLVKTLDAMPWPFGERQCRMLPKHGLPVTELFPSLSETAKAVMQQLESIHKGMTGGTYKVDNSSSIAEVRKICTTFGNDVAPTSDANNLGRRLQLAYGIGRICIKQQHGRGCLHLFVARFTNSQNAVAMLKSAIVKYIYVGVNLQSFCDKATYGSEDTAIALRKQLSPIAHVFRLAVETLDTVSPNNTGPWTCDEFPSPTGTGDPHTDSTTQSSKGIATQQASDATAAPIDDSVTHAVLKQARDSVLPTAGMGGSMAWEQRAAKHQTLADQIYENLTHSAHHGFSFQVLVSLLQDKDKSDMQCMESKSKRYISHHNSHGVSYFIQYFNTADLSVGLNDTWNDIYGKETQILDSVFSSITQDLCNVAKEQIVKAVDKKVFGLKDKFSGLAVVRCGRRFVWHQLGYRYFAVGRSAGQSFKLATGNQETYNSNCGQIFLFP